MEFAFSNENVLRFTCYYFIYNTKL